MMKIYIEYSNSHFIKISPYLYASMHASICGNPLLAVHSGQGRVRRAVAAYKRACSVSRKCCRRSELHLSTMSRCCRHLRCLWR